MREPFKRNQYMDYRNVVPFMDLSGYIVKQPMEFENRPMAPLQLQLMKKRLSIMVNLRRLQYCKLCEEYRNGRK